MALVFIQEDGGGNYISLEAAISASQTEIEIQETWTSSETANYTISSATTIAATGSAKTPGRVGASPTHWRAKPTSSGSHTFLLNADLTIEGMDISNQSTGTSDEVFRLNADNVDLVAKSCLLWLGARTDQQDIVYNDSKTSCTVLLENCIGWNAYRAVIDQFSGGVATYKINSCHFYDIGFSTESTSRSGIIGISDDSVIDCYIFNTLCHINTGYAFRSDNTNTNVTIDRSITNKAIWESGTTETITDSLVSHNWTDDDTKSSDGDWVIVEGLTIPPYDLRVVANSYNEAQDAHADGSGATLTMPPTDIVGTSRPQPANGDYDIGAFEIVAAGGLEIPIAMHHYTKNIGR